MNSGGERLEIVPTMPDVFDLTILFQYVILILTCFHIGLFLLGNVEKYFISLMLFSLLDAP